MEISVNFLLLLLTRGISYLNAAHWISYNKFNKSAAGQNAVYKYLIYVWQMCIVNDIQFDGSCILIVHIDCYLSVLMRSVSCIGPGPHWISNETLCSPFKKCHSQLTSLARILDAYENTLWSVQAKQRQQYLLGGHHHEPLVAVVDAVKMLRVVFHQRTKKLNIVSNACALFGPWWILDEIIVSRQNDFDV